MPKSWYTIKAAAEATAAEVSILDYIGMFGVNAPEFLKEFRAIKQKDVTVYINSPGGSVPEALAIFNGMRASGKNITVHILGVAASAASYIAMAGDKIVMPSNTMMFVHNPVGSAYGNAEDMRSMADLLDKVGESLRATYAKRWKGEAQAMADLFAEETYLTAKECLDYGFCDEVVDEIAIEAAFEVDRLPENVQALLKRKEPAEPLQQTQQQLPPALAEMIKAEADAAGLAGLAAVFAGDTAIVDKATLDAAVHAAVEIRAMASLIAVPEGTADDLIRQRKTVPEARAEFARLRAAADAAAAIDTARRGSPASAPSAIHIGNLWNEIKALQTAGSKK